MKKILALLCSACLLSTCFVGCMPKKPNDDKHGADKLITDAKSIEYGFNKLYKDSELSDGENGFSGTSDIKGARFLVNGEYKSEFTSFSSRQDIKMEFYNDNHARLVNASGGMAFTVPATDKLAIDYSIAKYRTQITLGDSILTASSESSNPYATISNPWGTYRDEWLLRWVMNDTYISKNGLERVGDVVFEDKTTRSGYDMYQYGIRILDPKNQIERPYYNIGVIREVDDPINFGLFVMKSKADRTEDMMSILMSYEKITRKGITKNYYDAGEPEPDPNWSDETKAYYAQIQSQSTVDWGAFSRSMPGGKDEILPSQSEYQKHLKWSKDFQNGIEEIWGHTYDIYPTYTHLGNSSSGNGIPSNMAFHYFPTAMAKELAGGNGKNGKPVLQFTQQFTTNNNIVADNITPMFDVLRGTYDDYFKRLATDMKEYGAPILFRLNNEMNTDWTSYCGMITLCDPDIFSLTWQYLYKFFEKEGVDNCIWIWNPTETSCPYSSWGEDLCYNPGKDYVHLLGLTGYEFNNTEKIKSFDELYAPLYEKNAAAFGKYRSIISEFAVGSGGAQCGLGHYRDRQVAWINEMFKQFNAENKPDYVKQIMGVIWFNANDYNNDGSIRNRLKFYSPDSDPFDEDYSDLEATWQAFYNGFNVS